MRDCQQQIPLPNKLSISPHLSVSVLQMLALKTILFWHLESFLQYCELTSNGKGNTTSGLSLGSTLLMPAIRKASGALPSYVKFLKDNLENEEQRFVKISPTWWPVIVSPEWRCLLLCCNGLFAGTSDIPEKWHFLGEVLKGFIWTHLLFSERTADPSLAELAAHSVLDHVN